MKSKSVLIAVFLMASALSQNHQEKYKDACNYDLVRAYGMIGRKTPYAARMEMCPGIRSSCCLKRDQIMMYNNWVHLKEGEFIKVRYNHNERIYVKLLHVLEKADKVIEDIKKKLQHKRISNCKELAKRIANYEVPQLIPQIKKNLRIMRDFMVTSFEGFYCSICDHKNHPYIDTSKRTVTYCDGFCRTLVETTLPNMLFWHVDIVKYLNMVTKFMVACDFKGDYESEAMIPKKYIFFQFQEDADKLNDCRDYRNKPEWMAYCAPVCQHFSMTNLDLFFEPNLQKIKKYIPWLEEKIEYKKTEHIRHPMFADEKKDKKAYADGKQNVKNNSRMLSVEKEGGKKEGKKEKGEEKDDKKGDGKKDPRVLHLKGKGKKKKSPGHVEDPAPLDILVFKSKMTSKVDLTGYTINFGEDGVCQYEVGANSVITDDMYNEVNTILHISRMTKKGGVMNSIKSMLGFGDIKSSEKDDLKSSGMFGARGLKKSVARVGVLMVSVFVMIGFF